MLRMASFSPEGEISMEHFLLWMLQHTLNLPSSPRRYSTKRCLWKANKLSANTMRTPGYRKIHRERKKERKTEGEELAGRRSRGFKFLAEMEHLTFVWSQLLHGGDVGAFRPELKTHTSHTRTGPHVSLAWRMERRQILCLCACLDAPLPRLLWMVVIELRSLSHNIISLHLCGVDPNWMADYS